MQPFLRYYYTEVSQLPSTSLSCLRKHIIYNINIGFLALIQFIFSLLFYEINQGKINVIFMNDLWSYLAQKALPQRLCNFQFWCFVLCSSSPQLVRSIYAYQQKKPLLRTRTHDYGVMIIHYFVDHSLLIITENLVRLIYVQEQTRKF